MRPSRLWFLRRGSHRAVAPSVFLVGAAVGLAACGSTGAARPSATTAPGANSPTPPPPAQVSLTITYWPHGEGADGIRIWTLRCQPLGGNHPARRRACAELTSATAPFAPPTHPCPLVIVRGSPVARIRGRFRGKTVSLIARPVCDQPWQRLHVLLTGQ